ncbi:sulfite exporter TauE/SafE family protein [Kordiimonas sp. SCSIO 12610]|uniref:sulfite exporter TauE/SafE family protein n=1 Tax=Kordiimonas sp. SCSIO 12610 TaxID=2829597 RepID=UPI00210D10ED|nr:sulfite exporter TauE/SafE family protein [Kordiimonas sp. SCSIO 12610]UTW55064.1 sulfite exporter TauE/SafE family protein [Kordiimonas sp. SCSIO 12610]
MEISPEILTIIALVFLVAGTIKGLIGIGLPTIAISLMSLVIDARLAITLTIIPMFASNIWQVYRGGKILETLRKYWIFSTLLIISIFCTALISRSVSSDIILIILGSVVTIYAILSLLKWAPRIAAQHDPHAQTGFGLAAGILGGFTAIWAPPLIIYLTSRQIPKDEFIRATGMLITVGSTPLLFGYVQNGLLTPELATTASLMTIPVLIGFIVGEFLRKYISTAKFHTIVLSIFAVMGANLVYRGFFS